MRMTFIGTGSAFTLPADASVRSIDAFNFHSNILLESGDRKLLLDCGSDARFALFCVGLRMHQITDVFLSHLHNDHTGGLECLGFSTLFHPKTPKPRMYVEEDMAAALWANVLSGGMGALQGAVASLATYFDVTLLRKDGAFEWQGIEFRLVPAVHFDGSDGVVPSYGLLFRPGRLGPLVYWTSDTQHTPDHLGPVYERADLIFHDCETAANKSSVHAHYSELRTLPAEIRAKTWLYHYQPGARPDCVADGFRGWVERGQVFEF